MDLAQIHQILDTAPAEKARRSEIAENLRQEWQVAKATLDRDEAKKTLALKAMADDRISMAELKVQVSADDEVYAKRMEVIKSESAYRSQVIKVTSAEDAFISARKSAELIIKEMSNLNPNV